MRTLVIDTATEACSIALFDEDEPIASDHRVLGRGHAEHLVPMIAGLPEKGRADRIAVARGPGSFTGVRVGIAAARALSFAWNVPCLGYSTPALVAAMALHEGKRAPVAVVMNGGHGEYFVQNFAAEGTAQDEVRSLPPEQAAQAARHRVIAGNRAQAVADLLDGEVLALELLPDANYACLLDDAYLSPDLTPIYGRGPDAKVPMPRVRGRDL